MPVIMTKKALDAGETEVTVAVDNATARENLLRLAASYSMKAGVSESDGVISVRMTGKPVAPKDANASEGDACSAAAAGGKSTVCYFIARDALGSGDDELGRNLMKMALYTLAHDETPPSAIAFMNGGVKLPAGDNGDVIESIKLLVSRGTKVLVCGTCLNFFKLTDNLRAGDVSNMYDILSLLASSGKVISL